jgi:hypothetical protein
MAAPTASVRRLSSADAKRWSGCSTSGVALSEAVSSMLFLALSSRVAVPFASQPCDANGTATRLERARKSIDETASDRATPEVEQPGTAWVWLFNLGGGPVRGRFIDAFPGSFQPRGGSVVHTMAAPTASVRRLSSADAKRCDLYSGPTVIAPPVAVPFASQGAFIFSGGAITVGPLYRSHRLASADDSLRQQPACGGYHPPTLSDAICIAVQQLSLLPKI